MYLLKSKKKIFLKITSVLACALLTVGCFTAGIAVSADTVYAVVTSENCYTSDNEVIKYVNDLTINGETIANKNQNTSKILANDEVAFCIEPQQGVSNYDELESGNSPVWNSLTESEKTALKLALMYGYQGNKDEFEVSDGELYVATQVIIWEVVSDFRNIADNLQCTDNSIINSVYDGSTPSVNAGVKKAYDIINNYLTSYNIMPSFISEETHKIEMQWNDIDKHFAVELVDENEVLQQFKITSKTENIEISVENNKLTLRTPTENQSIKLYFTRELPTTNSECIANFILWGSSSKQDLVTGLDCTIDMPIGVVEFFTENVIIPTEPITEPCTEPVTEPQTEPCTEPVTEPQTEPSTECITELTTENITQPYTDTQTHSATEITTCTVKSTINNTTTTIANSSNSKSTSTAYALSNTTGKVATGDSQTTIIVLTLLLAGSATTIGIANKFKKSNNAQ